jgi:hypothetical protein
MIVASRVVWACPVLRYACANQAVQRLSRGPHDVSTDIVVLWLFQRFWTLFNQGQQDAFSETILNFALHRVGYVLFHCVHKGVYNAVGDLTRWQGIGINRIQHGKHRLNVFVHKGLLVAGGFTGNNSAFIGFRAGCRQRQHGAHRDGAFDLAPTGLQNFPRVNAVCIVCRSGDKFGAVQH